MHNEGQNSVYFEDSKWDFLLVKIGESEVNKMTTKYGKILVLATTLTMSTMLIAPSYAEDTATAVITTPAVATGTIHVLSRVVNDSGGTKYPTDFAFALKHHGADVPGSPFIGAGNVGTTFVVPAGTYVVSAEMTEGYTGFWYNGAVTTGFIQLIAGQEVTIVRVFEDTGYSEEVIVTDPTEDGGLLPNTATPIYNYLLAGSLFAAAGALGIRKSIALGKAE